MKKIGQLLAGKSQGISEGKPVSRAQWDEKSIFYAFQRVVKEEYGNQGLKNLKPEFWKEGKLFIRTISSVWANEFVLKNEDIRGKLNQELGKEIVKEVKIKH